MRASTPGMHPTRESANCRGMLPSTPGIPASTPGMGRVRDPADRRGMRANTRVNRRP